MIQSKNKSMFLQRMLNEDKHTLEVLTRNSLENNHLINHLLLNPVAEDGTLSPKTFKISDKNQKLLSSASIKKRLLQERQAIKEQLFSKSRNKGTVAFETAPLDIYGYSYAEM